MSHYQKWVSSRRSISKEPTIYRCPHCDFSGDLDAAWSHIDQHPISVRQRRDAPQRTMLASDIGWVERTGA